MTIIDLITENISYKYLFYSISIAFLLRYIVTDFILANKKSKIENRKVNTIEGWMAIPHLTVLIICIILIVKVKTIYNFIAILCIPLYISILIIYFLQIIENVKQVKDREFNELEINSFLSFSLFILLVFTEKSQEFFKEFLQILEGAHPTFFQCFALIVLVLKTFFVSFFTLYSILIIIKNFKIIMNKILTKLNIKFNLYSKISNFFLNNDWYFYDFVLLKKYKKIKILIPILFIVDLTVLIICDIFTFLMYFIRYPILTLMVLFKYVCKFLKNIENLNISLFTFKWFRIMIIFSITLTYVMLKLFSINILPNIMDIFELISTVILIPLIFEQIFNITQIKTN